MTSKERQTNQFFKILFKTKKKDLDTGPKLKISKNDPYFRQENNIKNELTVEEQMQQTERDL